MKTLLIFRRSLFLILFITAYILGYTQNPSDGAIYLEENDILYRNGEITEYMRERCRLDVYYPKDEEGFSTVIWFHGGGLRAGNKSIPGSLKKQGFAVVAVNYRLFPKVKSPAYIDDAAAAAAWVFNHIEKYGGDVKRIFISGHSAGGYLTSMIGLDKSYLQKYGVDANSIAALIPFSGHTITHFTVREERGINGTQVVVDELAPIFHIRKDAPPLILITGDRELEMLGRYEENAYMYRMMKVIGHENTLLYEMDGFNHGGMANPAFYILRDYIKNFS
ncbi:MAG: alpha/beta hydrolase, partial [Cyclobacteriaceae bacterium]|nr:alpha/beta hydrolase [Cyclobacteriaceae bacterium]